MQRRIWGTWETNEKEEFRESLKPFRRQGTGMQKQQHGKAGVKVFFGPINC